MRTYKLAANVSGTSNNIANLTIAKSGRIQNVRWNGVINSVVDNDSIEVELSLFPTSFIGSNDSAGAIDEISILNNGTSGGAISASKVSALDLPVGLGEKLFLNARVVGSPAASPITCFVDVEE